MKSSVQFNTPCQTETFRTTTDVWSDAKCPVCDSVRALTWKVNCGGGWVGVLNRGDRGIMFGDSTSKGSKSRMRSLLLAASEATGISISVKYGNARNMPTSPDHDS